MFRIRELAEARGLNITTLAGRAGLAYSQVWSTWHETRWPARETLEKIAAALGVPVWALFRDAPDPPA